MPDKKRYARIKAQKKEEAARRVLDVEKHEQDVVMMIFYLRERIRKVQKDMNADLDRMTTSFPVFVMYSEKELSDIIETKKLIEALIWANKVRDPNFDQRILVRVKNMEKVIKEDQESRTQKNQNNVPLVL